MFLQLVLIHKSIKLLIISHKLNRIIKNVICIYILCCGFPFTPFLCYLIHSIIANSPSINIKLIYILLKK